MSVSAWSFRRRIGLSFAAVAALHLLAVVLVATQTASTGPSVVTISMVLFAYARGLIHAFDFDHVSMIDNSTRKFIAEGRRPAAVGLAFSSGHSTVVLATGLLIVAGSSGIRRALDPESSTAATLALIGLSVSGAYLLLVALANVASFLQAWRLRQALRRDPDLEVGQDALTPRGPAARVLTTPLRRIRHSGHVYLIGVLFSLGFDTSSQIGLMMLTAAAALAGTPPIALMALPVAFTAAMTLGDTMNGAIMTRMYAHAQSRQRVTFNLVMTGISIVAGLVVAVLAAASISETLGGRAAIVTWLTSVDTTWFGFGLAAVMGLIGLVALARWWAASRPQVAPGQRS